MELYIYIYIYIHTHTHTHTHIHIYIYKSNINYYYYLYYLYNFNWNYNNVFIVKSDNTTNHIVLLYSCNNFTLKMSVLATEIFWQEKCDWSTSYTVKWILLIICILCLILCSQQTTTCFVISWWIVHSFLTSFLLRSIIISFHLLVRLQSVFILNCFPPKLVTDDLTGFRIVILVKHLLH